ncbi:MAG: bifunctional [glutamate--ammonia ligase]-adenylyl-L-tyrosine phosphorylase/[glutamate--ammonia-ligase] adenylyltransferase [Cellvibrionaceae bacterium]
MLSDQILPSCLSDDWGKAVSALKENAPELFSLLNSKASQSEEFKHCWEKAFVGSEYIVRQCDQIPDVVAELIESGDLFSAYDKETYRNRLSEILLAMDAEEDLLKQLRLFRQREMVRLYWRDLSRLADMAETTRDVSLLAEATVDEALSWHYQKMCEDVGTPTGKYSGQPQQLIVLGMGKLGGFELNVSSDIDLIFCYPEKGETQGGRKELSNQEFFIKLGQRLIKAIDQVTADGFVFRVDMRLRPYGQSGALVCNFDALEDYYQTQGREWERYAMIKARVIAGDKIAGKTLMDMLRPFTYRRYLDFSAIEAMRDMKTMIRREVARRGLGNDVKLGAGGIREIEFVVQVFQLIRGGNDKRLQERSVLKLLPLLEAENMLAEGEAEILDSAYRFLRNAEHAIQAWRDEQTQSLPDDEAGQARIAWLMGFENWKAFLEGLNRHRENVEHSFNQVIAAPEEEQQSDEALVQWQDFWKGQVSEEELPGWLAQRGIDKEIAESEGWRKLLLFRESPKVQALAAEGKERLDQFMPLILKDIAEEHGPGVTLERILQLIESVLRRSAYLVLLTENPGSRKQLVKLCEASPWIANQLASHPSLLDELIDPRTLYKVQDKQSLQSDLQQQMLRIDPDDLEAQMNALRYFKLSHGLRVAASEVTGVLPLMKVSDYLTYIAEAVLEYALSLVWQQMTQRHGLPTRDKDVIDDVGFVVLGYGKMGGLELGHSSDLDLVFLHDVSPNGYTQADEHAKQKSIDNSTFYMRLGQKLIHMLNTNTTLGQLYEVDARLRPSGNSGMLVATLDGFKRYQESEAWTWEHQALVRARAVAGSERLAKDFDEVRKNILCVQRDKAELQKDVREMRIKMRDHLGSKGGEKESQFHLKQDAGGIVDIEFLVQYAVLSQAHQYPELTDWSDNVRILETLQKLNLMSDEEVSGLTEAYKAYRSAGHKLSLQEASGVVPENEFKAQREMIGELWDKWLS